MSASRLCLPTALAVAAGGLAVLPTAAHAAPDGSGLVISEVYGGGGNAGATYTHDFVELYNPTDEPINLAGKSLQYRAAANTGTAGSSSIASLNAAGTVPPGEYFVVTLGSNGAVGDPVPNVDFAGSAGVNMSGSNGQIFLADSLTGVDPDGPGNAEIVDPAVIDFVGFGTAAIAEGGAAAPSPGNNASSISRDAEVRDTDVNGDDFTPSNPPTPGAPYTEPEPPDEIEADISEIQGTGMASEHVGDLATTTGVVTAAYPDGGLFGFYLQEAGSGSADLDLGTHTASQGIFVRMTRPAGPVTVQPGQHVQVTGLVAEYAAQTQLEVEAADDVTVLPDEAAAPVPVSTYPTTDAQRESLEGMLFRPTGDFTVTETYNTNRFGEVVLARGDQPLIQPTELARPGSAEADAIAEENRARRILLDDGSSTGFLSNQDATPAYISKTVPVRVGAAVEFTEDLIFTEGGDPAAPAYRLQPKEPVLGPDNETSPASFESTRTEAPDEALIGRQGTPDLKVASFNVLNYFTTLGDPDDTNTIPSADGCTAYTDRDGDGNNVNTGCDQRGAWDPQDLQRQEEKIVAAINALDADVVGLMEIENSARLDEEPDEATQTLVDALNEDAGGEVWAANPSSADLPPAGQQDVITNAIIYKVDAVQRHGEARALGDRSGAGQPFVNAREPVAQAFTPAGGGEPFLVVVNHFKSKGSAGPFPGDEDTGDGQGASNGSRVLQATALRDWIPGLQADLGVEAVLLAGDFNSYGQEDPMHVLYDAGFANVEQHFELGKWSYNFQALSGSLDHVLANEAALARTTGADIWNINSGEALPLEYSRWNYHGTDFHDPGPFRSSDHDPVIVGLTAGTVAPPATASSVAVTMSAPEVEAGATVTATAVVTAAGRTPTGTVELTLDGRTVTAPLLDGRASVELGPFLTAGFREVAVRYGGDAATLASTGSGWVNVVPLRMKVSAKGKKQLTVRRGSRVKVRAKVAAGPFTTPAQLKRRLRIKIAGERIPARQVRTKVRRNGMIVVVLRGGFATRGDKRIRVILKRTPDLERVRTTFRVRVRR